MTPDVPCPTHREEETVSRYVAGTLEPGALEAFEIHLLGCAACQEAVREASTLAAALDSDAGERSVGPTAPAGAGPSDGEGTGGVWNSRVVWVAGSALAAAALAFWLLLPRSGALESLGTVSDPPPFEGLPVRGPAVRPGDPVTRGMAAYRAGRFAEAAEWLDRVQEPTPGIAFFLGISRLMAGEPEAAAALSRALEPPENPYAAEARFYLAKLHLRRGRSDSALAQLGAVAASPGAPDGLRRHAAALADSVRGLRGAER